MSKPKAIEILKYIKKERPIIIFYAGDGGGDVVVQDGLTRGPHWRSGLYFLIQKGEAHMNNENKTFLKR